MGTSGNVVIAIGAVSSPRHEATSHGHDATKMECS
jgi:hypothetical protein